jgi:tripeptide aminopeptidase
MSDPLTSRAASRFLRYVTFDTRSNEHSTSFPSTEGQLVLMRALVDDLRTIGMTDAALDDYGYVMATVPATIHTDAPVIGFVAHVDTSPEVSGSNVRPIVHERYDGRDLVLPDDPSAALRLSENPELGDQMGHDIITASGSTLLGADDKAGVAEIMAAAEHLMAHPDIPHGRIRIAFTPDEEIGRGTAHFDVARFGARFAYTLDGGSRGDIESENFSADAMTLTFNGVNFHPGWAKGRMVSALKLAAAFVHRLPQSGLSPETTEGYEGYVHPHLLQGAVERATITILLRDFRSEGLAEKARMLSDLANEVIRPYPAASVDVRVEESYRNMKEVLDRYPEVVEHAKEAIRRCGLTPRMRQIRGGTDGARLSYMGVPTPNLFAGEHNLHSRLEWVSVQDMDKAVEVIVQICRIWAEKVA